MDMAMYAIALVRVPAQALLDAGAPASAVVRALEDGALLRTGEPFSAEPEVLARAVRAVAGRALDEHEDARGILMIPDVADPRATTYEGVVQEIGAGGTWTREGGDGLLEILGAAQALAGQSPELERAMASLLGAGEVPDPRAQAALGALERMMKDLPLDLRSPEMREAIAKMAGELERNPEMLRQLTEQLFESLDEEPGEDDTGEPDGSGGSDRDPPN